MLFTEQGLCQTRKDYDINGLAFTAHGRFAIRAIPGTRQLGILTARRNRLCGIGPLDRRVDV
jgi:hypothetical protein